jgi:adenylate kinase
MVIMGTPGAGKGTQADIISKRFNIPHISSGALLREVASQDSPLGRDLKACMDSGALAPNDLIIKIMEERLNNTDCKNGFIIDGFPRAGVEAQALEEILARQGRKLGNVIEIKISLEECIGRLSIRGRHDDREDVIRKRHSIYLKETHDVREYFKLKKDLYKEISGDRTVDNLTEEIIKLLEDQIKKESQV